MERNEEKYMFLKGYKKIQFNLESEIFKSKQLYEFKDKFNQLRLGDRAS